jgi:hypothetical protein
VLGNCSTRSGMLEPDQHLSAMLPLESMPSGAVHLRIASNESCSLAEFSGGLDRRLVTLGVTGFYLSTGDP